MLSVGKIKLKQIATALKRRLLSPPYEQTELANELYIQKKDLEIISCSNIVLHVQTEQKEGYLSECRTHLPIREYVERFVDDYFALFRTADERAASDQSLIRKTLENPTDFEKFTLIGKSSPYCDSPYCRYLRTNDGEEVGLHLLDADEDQKTRIRHFTERYAWPQLTAYFANSDAKMGAYHCHTTAKVLATEAMARLIGLEDAIPHSQYVKLVVSDAENRVIFGNFMEKARGICAMDIPGHHRKAVLTPDFQRAMLNMNLLDVITHEQDHSPNNYNVVIDDRGFASGISVYDNNGVGTFSLNFGIDYETYKKCSSFLRADGTVNRPCLDKTVANAVMMLTWKEVKDTLSPWLSKPVIWCTWNRIVALQQAIKRSIESNPDFLRDREAFTEKTIDAELSGRYGKTYLVSFFQDCLEREKYH